ncbi:hypothetical protein BDC45DRAFT_552741 [Circinella umbellata]|nr:hypothetical protein BDC45DRAFT_552741 [Circinella umbellata]
MNRTNGKLYLPGGKDRAFFVERSTGGQVIQFSTIRRYAYLGGMATTTRRLRPMENCIWLGDDQLEGKRCSFPRFDDTLTLATWRQRHDDQGQWKTVSGWGTINWRASDAVFHDSTIRLPWRHGDNDTMIKTNGKLYLAGGRSTGGQAMQFSSIRRYAYLGDMATTTRRSRPMENCIWLGVRIGLFFVGRSTGGQAIQFSTVRRRRLPWWHGDNDTTIKTNRKLYLAGGKDRAFFCRTINWRASDAVFHDSTIRLPWRHGDNDTMIKTNGKLYLAGGKDRAFFCRTINWRASDAVFLDSTIRLPWRHGDNDTKIKTNGKLYLAGGKDRAFFCRTINWRASDTVFHDSTIRLPWWHGDNDMTIKANGELYLAGDTMIKTNGKLYLAGGRSTGGQAMQFSSIRRRRLPWRHGDNDTKIKTNGKLYLAGDAAIKTNGKLYLAGDGTIKTNGKLYLAGGNDRAFFCRTINWRASDAVFLDLTIRLPWRHGDNDTTIKAHGKLYLAGDMTIKANGELYLAGEKVPEEKNKKRSGKMFYE